MGALLAPTVEALLAPMVEALLAPMVEALLAPTVEAPLAPTLEALLARTVEELRAPHMALPLRHISEQADAECFFSFFVLERVGSFTVSRCLSSYASLGSRCSPHIVGGC